MRGKMVAGVVMALAFVIPAAPAVAQAAAPGLDQACQTVERKTYRDIRDLIKIDLDTASEQDLEVLAGQVLTVARNESLPVLPDAIEDKLDGGDEADLRAFLKVGVLQAWEVALRVSVVRTLTGAGPNVQAATQKVLDTPDAGVDVYRAYLNEGVYEARALDCAAQPTPTPTVTPTVTPTATPGTTPGVTTPADPDPTASTTPAAPGGENGGEGGGLPVTGSNTGLVAAVGGALLVLGGFGYVLARRRRSRFVA
ncbi:LPXTG cell wall anchor domain-containing protein [Actinoplanes sp. TRM 88003]|uniref:LPXTG cell wall anchor domain-containing protein n=1 Tax=Paractinoplanes aksuensis TaxID=2939490 RepID=A0ABT1E1B1_9ACTN|nr:LPXTG cell wall anchor domain-containing protein [Actinoplanes aksuensis]MCO8276795.1 LPXTG cell wall anchor domain-containing protein [Actinoplanes aksuensis]